MAWVTSLTCEHAAGGGGGLARGHHGEGEGQEAHGEAGLVDLEPAHQPTDQIGRLSPHCNT